MREIVNNSNGAAPAIEPAAKDYLDRLFKLIPAEATAGFLAVHTLADPTDIDRFYPVLLAAAFFGLIFLPIYLLKAQQVVSVAQHVLTILSFFVWAANISAGRLEGLIDHTNLAIILICWTALAPLLIRPKG